MGCLLEAHAPLMSWEGGGGLSKELLAFGCLKVPVPSYQAMGKEHPGLHVS